MQATRTGIELHNGLPFEVRIPPKQIPNRTTMTDDEIDASRSEYASSTLVAMSSPPFRKTVKRRRRTPRGMRLLRLFL